MTNKSNFQFIIVPETTVTISWLQKKEESGKKKNKETGEFIGPN
jgi:aminopeptidase-like protein